MKDNNYGKKQQQQRQHRKVRICNGAGANRCSIKSKSPKVRIIRHSNQNTFTTICNVSPPTPLNSTTNTKSTRINKIDIKAVQPVTKVSKLVLSDTTAVAVAHVRPTKVLLHTNTTFLNIGRRRRSQPPLHSLKKVKPYDAASKKMQVEIIEKENQNLIQNEIEHVSHDTSQVPVQVDDTKCQKNDEVPQPTTVQQRSFEPEYDNKPSFISQLLMQGNLKCMDLNLPAEKPKSPAVMSQKSVASATSSPPTKKQQQQPTYDKEATREYMKKQQDQWKDKQQLEQRTKVEEKQLIKLRLKQLQETQKNLVKANIKKKVIQKLPSSPSLHAQRTTMGPKGSPTNCHKKPSSIALTPEKTITTKNVPRKSPETVKPLTPVKLSPEEPLKGGLIRTIAATQLKEDLFSPLKLGDLTVHTPLTKQQNLQDISRPWNNTTQFGDLTLNLEGSTVSQHLTPRMSETAQETSPGNKSEFIELKSPTRYSMESKLNDAWKESTTNVWFNETHIKSTPYTFLTALNHKLGAAIKQSTQPVIKKQEIEVQTENEVKIDVAIQENLPFDGEKRDVPKVEVISEEPKVSVALPPNINFSRPIMVVESATPSESLKEVKLADKVKEVEELPLTEKDQENQKEEEDTTSEISSMKSDSMSSNDVRQQYSSNFEATKENSLTKDEKLKKNLEKIQEMRFDPVISAKSDDVVVRRHSYVNVPGSKRDEEYKKLLSDFKASLKNFIDLNKQLNEVKAKASQAQSTSSTKDKTSTTPSQDSVEQQKSKDSKSDAKDINIATSYSSSFDSSNQSSTATSLAQTIPNATHPLNLNELIVDRSSIRSTSNASTSSSPSKATLTFEGETVPTLSKTVSSYHHSYQKSENIVHQQQQNDNVRQLKEEDEEAATAKSVTPSLVSTKESKSSARKKVAVDESIKEIDTYDEESSIDTDSNVSNLNVSYSTVGMIDQLIYNSVLKENHVLGVCELRAKSIIDRLKSQLSYLEIKKQKIKQLMKQNSENEKYNEELYSIRKKQRAIIIKLDQARKSLQVIIKLQSTGLLSADSTPSKRSSHLKQKIWNKTPNFNESIKTNQLKAISAPLKCFEMGSTTALEKLMTKREQTLLERRRKLDEFMQWQKKLDEEETHVMEMEKDLVTQNLAHLKNETREPEIEPVEVVQQVEPEIEAKSEIESKIAQENVEPEVLEKEEEISESESSSIRSLKGSELNVLWHRLTGRKEEKYEPEKLFTLTKSELKQIYENASELIYTSDENYLRELCVVPQEDSHVYSDTFSEHVESSPEKLPEEKVETEVVVEVEDSESTLPFVEEPVETTQDEVEPKSSVVPEPTSESIGDDISDLPMSEVKSAPVETNGLPDIISEAEVLRIQQLQIEQEIVELQRQVSFSIVDNKIPNKPPPPYTLPIEPVADTFEFPAVPVITELVAKRVEQLHTPKPPGSIVSETVTANIYERLIIDMTEEFYFQIVAESQPGGCGMKAFFHKFFSTTKDLKHLQEFVGKKVLSICMPMVEKAQHGNRYLKQRTAQNKGKDVVDHLLLKEVVSEDPHWSCFDVEESTIKDELVCSIMKLLIDETVEDILEIL